jgi:hypothetical protein
MLLLTAQCTPTRIQGIIGSKYVKKFCQGAESYQSMNIGGHTVTVNAHNVELYRVINEAQKIADGKARNDRVKTAQLPMFITQERTGSQKVQHGTRGGRRYFQYDNTYETVYHDCLCGKEWLSQHEHDEYSEPTIDLMADGKELHINGNYKAGIIKDFVKSNRESYRQYCIESLERMGIKQGA